MLAEKNQGIKKSIVTLHKMTEDEKIREQCEGRERYQKDMLAATKIGLEEGLEQGIEQGMICTLQDLGYTYEETYTKFKVKFERTDDECKQKMDLYWKK